MSNEHLLKEGDLVWTKSCPATKNFPYAWTNNCDGGLPTAVRLPLIVIHEKGFPLKSSWGFWHCKDMDGKVCYVDDHTIDHVVHDRSQDHSAVLRS